ncbi:MAG: serine/threonine-protein kinase [Sandaracinaceae bacterium]
MNSFPDLSTPTASLPKGDAASGRRNDASWRTTLTNALLDRRPPPERLGPYVVGPVLGVGGTAHVYRAVRRNLGLSIALKVADLDEVRGGAERLYREAEALSRVEHPHVVDVIDVGTIGTFAFLALERLETSLASWRRALRSHEEVLRHLTDVGAALAATHRAGLLHRDVKPHNMMLDSAGRARLIDFGIACSGRECERRHGDGVRVPVGTPNYMAPEQYRGDPIDARADQFGFCVSLFELLTRERPFRGETPDEVYASAMRGRVSIGAARLPDRLRPVVVRGLSARPDDRYPSMDALLDDLQRATERRSDAA